MKVMCSNKSCPSFEICWKAQATPKKVQLYDNKLKVLEGNTRCEAYEEMRPKDGLQTDAGGRDDRSKTARV